MMKQKQQEAKAADTNVALGTKNPANDPTNNPTNDPTNSSTLNVSFSQFKELLKMQSLQMK